MSQSTPTPTPCPVCGRPDCDQHAESRIVRLSPYLIRRLVSAPHSNIWTRYQIDPSDQFGLIPLTIYVNPVDTPLTGAFWVKETETRRGDVHHASIYLVAVPAVPAPAWLSLHEAGEAFAIDRRHTLAAGHTQAGFFVLTTDLVPPAVAERTIVFGHVLGVSELNALPGWQPGRFGGVIRQTAVINRDLPRPGAVLTVYDHRESPTPTAFVAVTEKTGAGRRWFHLDLYPDDDDAIGRVAVGRLDLTPGPGEQAEWLFHSTSTDSQQRQQSVTVVAIFVRDDEALPVDPDKLAEKCTRLAAEFGGPAVLCDALEDLVLARFNAGALTVDETQEASWGRIAAMRARAERTTFPGEAFVAWKKAIFALAKMAAFPFGHFDAYVADLESKLPAADETSAESQP